MKFNLTLPYTDKGTLYSFDQPTIGSTPLKGTFILPSPVVDSSEFDRIVAAEKDLEGINRVTLDRILDALWQGMQHVQILADAINIEIPFLQQLPQAIKVT